MSQHDPRQADANQAALRAAHQAELDRLAARKEEEQLQKALELSAASARQEALDRRAALENEDELLEAIARSLEDNHGPPPQAKPAVVAPQPRQASQQKRPAVAQPNRAEPPKRPAAAEDAGANKRPKSVGRKFADLARTPEFDAWVHRVWGNRGENADAKLLKVFEKGRDALEQELLRRYRAETKSKRANAAPAPLPASASPSSAGPRAASRRTGRHGSGSAADSPGTAGASRPTRPSTPGAASRKRASPSPAPRCSFSAAPWTTGRGARPACATGSAPAGPATTCGW